MYHYSDREVSSLSSRRSRHLDSEEKDYSTMADDKTEPDKMSLSVTGSSTRRSASRDRPSSRDRRRSRDTNDTEPGESPPSLLDQRLAGGKDSSTERENQLKDIKAHFQEGPGGQTPGRFAMSGGKTGKLAQEIHDEFLVCKICLEGYKNPKSLNCLHTFCEECIESHVMSESTYKKYSDYREFTCPLCRKRTQLPIGGVKKLPDNFLVSSLSEIVTRQKPSKFPFCDLCKVVNRKHREAVSKCLDCAKLLCKQCVELHRETKVTAAHSIFDVEIEKDIECKEHQDEVVRFYCEPCETCICVLCTFNEHKDHDITQFGDAVAKYKENIQTMLDSCQGKIQKFDDQIDKVNKVEEIIKEAEAKVHESAILFISDIRTREKQLIEELHNLYGKDLMEHVENKKDLTTTVESLRSTCNLTEVILKGKDIELLLLKKDVQKKLSSLEAIEIKTLPTSVSKQVVFIAGAIDFGVLQDSDRPLISKLKHKKLVVNGEKSNSVDVEEVTYATYGTQTDLSHKDVRDARDESDSESESESESSSDDEPKKKKVPTATLR